MAIIHDTTMKGLTAAWRLPDGTQARGILATAEYVPGDH
jgi:hypothetical protein